MPIRPLGSHYLYAFPQLLNADFYKTIVEILKLLIFQLLYSFQLSSELGIIFGDLLE